MGAVTAYSPILGKVSIDPLQLSEPLELLRAVGCDSIAGSHRTRKDESREGGSSEYWELEVASSHGQTEVFSAQVYEGFFCDLFSLPTCMHL